MKQKLLSIPYAFWTVAMHKFNEQVKSSTEVFNDCPKDVLYLIRQIDDSFIFNVEYYYQPK